MNNKNLYSNQKTSIAVVEIKLIKEKVLR